MTNLCVSQSKELWLSTPGYISTFSTSLSTSAYLSTSAHLSTFSPSPSTHPCLSPDLPILSGTHPDVGAGAADEVVPAGAVATAARRRRLVLAALTEAAGADGAAAALVGHGAPGARTHLGARRPGVGEGGRGRVSGG